MNDIIFEAYLDNLPPTVNHYYYRQAYGHVAKKEIAQQWQKDTVLYFIVQNAGKALYTKNIEVNIIFTTNNKKRWDIDNRIKILLDCLTLADIIKDDSQIQRLHIERIYGKYIQTKITVKEYKP